MSNDKKKYYTLDDLHEIVSEKRVTKKETKTDNSTREFFAKRRIIGKKKVLKEKV
jgi:hypothetical protein